MFDPNVGVGRAENEVAEDTRLHGYDPLIPPALIQEEIPQVCPPQATAHVLKLLPYLFRNFWT